MAGTTYVALLGGTVDKDIYGSGSRGDVTDYLAAEAETFTASTNVYIGGGSVRNVYGGGWRGDVGYHKSGRSNTDTDKMSYMEIKNVSENTSDIMVYASY